MLRWNTTRPSSGMSTGQPSSSRLRPSVSDRTRSGVADGDEWPAGVPLDRQDRSNRLRELLRAPRARARVERAHPQFVQKTIRLDGVIRDHESAVVVEERITGDWLIEIRRVGWDRQVPFQQFRAQRRGLLKQTGNH